MSRFWIIALIIVLTLSSCTGNTRQSTMSAEEARTTLQGSIDRLRALQSFRMDVVQGGAPYRFYFQLGPSDLSFETVMNRADGAYIAPNNLYANARISIRGVLVNIGLFATTAGQWIRPLSGNWVEYLYAPGFDPRDMMQEGSGFRYAIDNLTETEFLGYKTINGEEVLHIRGNATNEIVNSLLFGLLYVLEEMATVDVFIDPISLIPTQLLLTLPDTAREGQPDTFWQIDIYDVNQPVTIDAPEGTLSIVPDVVTEINWLPLLGVISAVSAILGMVITPFIFRGRGYSTLLGIVAGAISGGLGSLVLLLPLWSFLPNKAGFVPKERVSHPEIDYTQVNPWVVMAFIAIPVFVGSLDLTVVSAFLPQLVSELGLPFDTGLDDASWVVTGYLLAYTISMTFTGRLSDLIGRRAVYIASLLVFIVGSVMVAVSDSAPTEFLLWMYRSMGTRPDPAYVTLHAIIIGRVIQALGAGALVPVSLALVGDIFPADRRARPLGLVAAMDTLGWVLGPVYGGLFMQFTSWHGLFWVNVPLTLIALFAVLYALRRVPEIFTKGKFDYWGTILIIGTLSALTIGLGANIDATSGTTRIEDLKPLPEYAPIVLTGMVVLFILFIVVEQRIKDPLVNLAMFKRRSLAGASITNLLVGYCLFIGLVSVPILVNLRQESISTLSQAALQVGALLSTLTLPMAFVAVPGGWLSDRIGIRSTTFLGLLLATTGFILIWRTWTYDISDLAVGLQMALVGTGIGLTFSPVSTAIINSAHEDERGVAGAIVLILRLVGMTISISTLSSVMFYRVNALATAAANASGEFDPNVLVNAYTNSAVQVLGEMGLIGAVLCLIAIIPTSFIAQHITQAEE